MERGGHPVPFSLTALMNYAPSPSLIHALCDIVHSSLAFVLQALMSCLHDLKGIVWVCFEGKTVLSIVVA